VPVICKKKKSAKRKRSTLEEDGEIRKIRYKERGRKRERQKRRRRFFSLVVLEGGRRREYLRLSLSLYPSLSPSAVVRSLRFLPLHPRSLFFTLPLVHRALVAGRGAARRYRASERGRAQRRGRGGREWRGSGKRRRRDARRPTTC